jgi:hypothetical protein
MLKTNENLGKELLSLEVRYNYTRVLLSAALLQFIRKFQSAKLHCFFSSFLVQLIIGQSLLLHFTFPGEVRQCNTGER